MAWCPKCKCEYVEGVDRCADCGCELVEHLTDEPEERFTESLPESPEEEGLTEYFQGSLEEEGAVFRQAAMEKAAPQIVVGKKRGKPVVRSVYVNNEERAEENRTSAYTLLSVGTAGLVAVVLLFTGVIPIQMAVFSRYMICGVMGVVFILFLVMGVVSLRNFKLLKKRAVKENNLTDEIQKWCLQNLHKETIDEVSGLDASVPEELKYFQRFEFVKNEIQKQFMNLDESYVERIVEEMYPELFEKQDKV